MLRLDESGVDLASDALYDVQSKHLDALHVTVE
jgi:hypothetical protein